MKIRDIMTKDPACCTPDSTVQHAAQMMADCDCGEIPVAEKGHLVGVITDRDIACRVDAKGKSSMQVKVRDIMSKPVITVPLDSDVDECCQVMRTARIRRVPVVDAQGCCCGIVSQADIACRSSETQTGRVVHDISQPTADASHAREMAAV